MLNELYKLSGALSGMKISTKEWHREYKPLPKASEKAPCFRIWLSYKKTICDAEELNFELVQTLRKFGNNQGTIPAFNIAPLYRIVEEKHVNYIKHVINDHSLLNIDEIKQLCINNNWDNNLIKKINYCLHNTSLRLLEIIKKQNKGRQSAIVELLKLADSYTGKPDGRFRSALEKCLFQKLQEGKDISTVLRMLFFIGNPKAKDPEKDCGSLSVILDLSEWQQYGHPIASKYTTDWINDILLESDQSDVGSLPAEYELDAFGMPFSSIGEPMPSVRLKGFDVTLRSMFSGQPCQYRYGKIDDSSYPIAKENRSLVKKSLEWLSQTDKEGTTWRQADKDEIIFAYPSKIPKVPLKFVSLLGMQQDNGDEQTKARFEQIAKDFIQTLNGIPPKDRPDSIQIFSIRKMDKARSKVVFTRNCTPEWFIHSAEQWQDGCNNIPNMEIPKLTPFPLQVARIVNNVWKQNGELANQGKTVVKRMQYYQGMELLLDFAKESTIHYYLNVLLSHTIGLVKHAGNWQHSRLYTPNVEKETYKNKKEIALLLPVYGLFLYKCCYKKEDYMNNAAYLVGQILKISDELHTLYCQAERHGEIPSQLAGNSMFMTASETPNQAIAQLSARMNPYISWAKRYRRKNITDKGKESWRAGWFLDLYQETANKLHPILADSMRFDDFSKAQVFIGYLASFPKKAKSDKENDGIENNTSIEEGDCYGQRN